MPSDGVVAGEGTNDATGSVTTPQFLNDDGGAVNDCREKQEQKVREITVTYFLEPNALPLYVYMTGSLTNSPELETLLCVRNQVHTVSI